MDWHPVEVVSLYAGKLTLWAKLWRNWIIIINKTLLWAQFTIFPVVFPPHPIFYGHPGVPWTLVGNHWISLELLQLYKDFGHVIGTVINWAQSLVQLLTWYSTTSLRQSNKDLWILSILLKRRFGLQMTSRCRLETLALSFIANCQQDNERLISVWRTRERELGWVGDLVQDCVKWRMIADFCPALEWG